MYHRCTENEHIFSYKFLLLADGWSKKYLWMFEVGNASLPDHSVR
jgi:hypothetical protein